MQREFDMKFGKLIEPLDIERYRETQYQRINLLKPGLKQSFHDIYNSQLDDSISKEATILLSHLQVATAQYEELSRSQSMLNQQLSKSKQLLQSTSGSTSE